MKTILLFLLFSFGYIYPEADTTFTFDLFTVKIIKNSLQVFNPGEKVLFQKSYNHPSVSTTDLDGDGVEELILSDYLEKRGKKDYILYVYSTIGSFRESSVIYSGYFEPYITYSDEVQKNLIISGDSSLNYFNYDPEMFYPLICWEYEDGDIIIVNNELYDIFISENDTILDYLEGYFQSNVRNCNSGTKVKNAVAAGYINYMSAGEITMAEHLLSNYYFCSDIQEFKLKLDAIINKDQ